MRRRWRGGRARRGVDDSHGVVALVGILDVGIVGREGLRIVVLGVVFLLLLAFGFLLLVEFALVLLVFADTSLGAMG